MPIFRSLASVFVGSIVAMLVVAIVQFLGHQLFPVPLPTDIKDPEELRKIIGQLLADNKIPLAAFLSILIAWCAGALCGAAVAAKLANRARTVHGLLVGALILAASVFNLVMIPHPTWFAIASLLLVPASAWLGASLGRPSPPAASTAAA